MRVAHGDGRQVNLPRHPVGVFFLLFRPVVSIQADVVERGFGVAQEALRLREFNHVRGIAVVVEAGCSPVATVANGGVVHRPIIVVGEGVVHGLVAALFPGQPPRDVGGRYPQPVHDAEDTRRQRVAEANQALERRRPGERRSGNRLPAVGVAPSVASTAKARSCPAACPGRVARNTPSPSGSVMGTVVTELEVVSLRHLRTAEATPFRVVNPSGDDHILKGSRQHRRMLHV